MGGVQYCVRFVFLCTPFRHFHVLEYWHESSATHCQGGLLNLTQVQSVHTIVELAAQLSGIFNAIFLANGSDERQRSDRIQAVGCWFESG